MNKETKLDMITETLKTLARQLGNTITNKMIKDINKKVLTNSKQYANIVYNIK